MVRWMRGRQLQELTPEIKAVVEAREARKEAGLPALVEEDDDD